MSCDQADYFGDKCRQRLQRKQSEGAGISVDRLVGPVMEPGVFTVITAAYCNLLMESLDPWLDHIRLSLVRRLVFMPDNALPHSARSSKYS